MATEELLSRQGSEAGHWPLTPGTANRSSRRQQILAAALECFSTSGYARATMEDIRERSGASVGSLYHHFKSKEQLAAELFVEGVRSYQAGVARELSRQSDAKRGIHAVVAFHLEWVESNPAWARYLMQSREADFVAATKPAMMELNRKMFQQFSDWIEPFVEAGEVKRLPGDLYGAILIGPAQHYARARLRGREKTDPTWAGKMLGEAAWNAIRTQGEPQ